MSDLHATVSSSLAERYEALAAKIRELVAPLSDEQFWRKPFRFGNSCGHLLLHLTGNLNYYIGTEILGTGYLRDRDLEFSETQRPAKQEVLRRFDEAVTLVLRAIRTQSEADWSKAYTARREEDAGNRFNIFLRCATHLHLHMGQLIYVRYQLER
jgi:uncharacterized damage-inducible protein DinB